MKAEWVDKDAVTGSLKKFFSDNQNELREFSDTVNQVFEAFVFTSVAKWYMNNGWDVKIINPNNSTTVLLKFNTRGKPSNYSYAECKRENECVQIRHSLRVATKSNRLDQEYPANVVLDVSVIENVDLSQLKTDGCVENSCLKSFGEAKHMSAFAELVCNFIGLVNEMMPGKLVKIRPYIGPIQNPKHPAPFLYVSGFLYTTAKGVTDTIRYRGYDIDVYDNETGQVLGMKLSMKPIPKKSPKK
jgi:hypothetical protein